ncbi:MAG: hypothetical protein Fur0041_06180 [Bacteroidia bacterium]
MKRALTILLLFLIPAALLAQNQWTKKAAVGGFKRSRAVGFAIGNRGYIACGEDTADQMMNDMWEYDPGSDTWSQKATFPGFGRRDACGFAIGNKGYICCGIDASESAFGNNLNDLWEYSPATNSWTQKSPYPGSSSVGGVYFAGSFVVSGKGYVVCGKQSNSNYSAGLWEYNPATDQWLQKQTFPGGTRYSLCAFTIGTKAYVGLGVDENILQTDLWEYNPSSNTWLQKANFPGSGRFSASTFTLNNKGYVACGSDGGYKNDLWEYDPVNNVWNVKAPFNGGERRSAVSFVINGAAYIGTGKGYTGSRRDFWQYQPWVTGEEENIQPVQQVYPNPAADVINFSFAQNVNDATLIIADVTGRVITEKKISNQNSIAINCADWAKGAYIYQFIATNGNQSNGRIIVQH